MSKKRVHEIAKELKSFGIDLDNKEVVTELAALGYDVKSHSSSLEDDQATSAVQRIVEKRKPRAAPPPVAAKGFVVRRRAPGADLPHTNGTPAAMPEAVHVPEPEPEAEPAPEPSRRCAGRRSGCARAGRRPRCRRSAAVAGPGRVPGPGGAAS